MRSIRSSSESAVHGPFIARGVERHSGASFFLHVSPDATLLVSAGLETNVHFWDVSTGRLKAGRLMYALAKGPQLAVYS
jgi:hypothetical protein